MEEKPVINFAGSISGVSTDNEFKDLLKNIYRPIITLLKEHGKVINAYQYEEELNSQKDEPSDPKEVHERAFQSIAKCQVMVTEVTHPSLGVGYEIGKAVTMGKKILCLYRPQGGKSLSAMIRGADNNETFIVRDYEDVTKDVPNILTEFFQIIRH